MTKKETDILDQLLEIPRGIGGAYHDVIQNAAIEIERLRKERDEARWRLCKVVGDNRGVWGCEIAKENGWDYLATESKP